MRYPRHPAEDVVEKMVELGRPGRARGAGFFDYDEYGKRAGLRPGPAELFPVMGKPVMPVESPDSSSGPASRPRRTASGSRPTPC